MKTQMAIREAFDRLRVIPWSAVPQLPPLKRAKTFFMKDCDDIEIATAAKSAIMNAVDGKWPHHRVEAKWFDGITVVFAEDEQDVMVNKLFSDFKTTWSFYTSIMNLSHDIPLFMTPDMLEAFPSVSFHATGCKICKTLDRVRFAKKSPYYRTLCPPWHFDCASAVFDSESKTISKNLPTSIGLDEYLFNPIDFLVANGIMRDFPGFKISPGG